MTPRIPQFVPCADCCGSLKLWVIIPSQEFKAGVKAWSGGLTTWTANHIVPLILTNRPPDIPMADVLPLQATQEIGGSVPPDHCALLASSSGGPNDGLIRTNLLPNFEWPYYLPTTAYEMSLYTGIEPVRPAFSWGNQTLDATAWRPLGGITNPGLTVATPVAADSIVTALYGTEITPADVGLAPLADGVKLIHGLYVKFNTPGSPAEELVAGTAARSELGLPPLNPHNSMLFGDFLYG